MLEIYKLMEENQISTDFNIQKPKRPQLLTVLCILSFIMCGISVLSNIYSLYQNQPEVMQKNIEQMRAFSPEMADKMEDQILAMADNPYMKIAPYLTFVYILVSFLGVIMMWNLKKNGFYIYAIAEILPYTGFIFMGKNSLSMMSGGFGGATAGMILIIVMVVIDLVFVGLYAKNLKEMR